MKDKVLGIVRHLLTFGGGYLAAKGLADQATVDAIIAGVPAIIGVLWSVFSKKPAAEAK